MDRRIVLCRELTKLYEEVLRLTLREASAQYAEAEPRGEYVLILAGKPASDESESPSLESCLVQVRTLQSAGRSLGDAVRQVSRDSGIPRNVLYDAALKESGATENQKL